MFKQSPPLTGNGNEERQIIIRRQRMRERRSPGNVTSASKYEV